MGDWLDIEEQPLPDRHPSPKRLVDYTAKTYSQTPNAVRMRKARAASCGDQVSESTEAQS